MANDKYKDIIDFLKYGIGYSENRISIVDNKASILIAVQTLLFGLFVFIIKEVFWPIDHPLIKTWSYIILSIAFIIYVITVILLLLAIRPSEKYFWGKILLNGREEDVDNYVMWLNDNNKKLREWENYKDKIKNFTQKEIKDNYEKTHHVSLQLAYAKYKFYPKAATGMKALFLCNAFGFLGFVIILYFF